jgi:hypothetical protein
MGILAGIEHKSFRRANCSMLDHGLPAVRCHDPKCDTGARILHLIQMRMLHCSWMEGGDLIVVEIGGDECLGRIGPSTTLM